MSFQLRTAMEMNESYMQSPVDDMESMFWTMVWAATFNIKHSLPTDRENVLKAKLRGNLDARTGAEKLLIGIKSNGNYNPILSAIAPLLRDWSGSLEKMTSEWMSDWEAVETATDKSLLFHRYAYRGVLDFLTIVGSRRQELQMISKRSISFIPFLFYFLMTTAFRSIH